MILKKRKKEKEKKEEKSIISNLHIPLVNYRDGLKKIPRVRVLHCYREANKCVDVLVRRGALLSQDIVVFSFPPSDVSLLVSLDASKAM